MSRRMRWSGNVVHMEEKQNMYIYSVLKGNPEGKTTGKV
jgi:hypothetical protein